MKAWRRALCSMLVGVLLFAHWSIAAYACPRLSSDSVAAMQAADMSGPCEDLDAPNLCAEHCKAGQQSDQTAQVSVPAPALNGFYLVTPAPVRDAPPRRAPVALHRATAPPHTILHCCYRI